MKHANTHEGEHLPAHLHQFLNDPRAELSPKQQARLRSARHQALNHFGQRARQSDSPLKKLTRWGHRHSLLLRRGSLALGFALITGLSLLLVAGQLVEAEAIHPEASTELDLAPASPLLQGPA